MLKKHTSTLGVKKDTYYNSLYYKLDRFPLEIDRIHTILIYWLKIRKVTIAYYEYVTKT
jgi:hypothetical protein